MKVLVVLCLLVAVASASEYAGDVHSTAAPYQAGVLHANHNAGDAHTGVTILTPNGSGDSHACTCLGQPTCPCNPTPTCCHPAETQCHPAMPRCSVVLATVVPHGSLTPPAAPVSCCQHQDVCHPSVPRCPVDAGHVVHVETVGAIPQAPVAQGTQGSITTDAAIPNIKWGQLPPNMQPVKVLGANLVKDECGCLHLPSCECRAPFTTPELKAEPCTCHAEAECPCAGFVTPAAADDTSCCPAEAQCHPTRPKCGAQVVTVHSCGCVHLDVCPCRTVEPEIKETHSCGCLHLSECPCRQMVEPEVKESFESNCCHACEDKPRCKQLVEAEEAPPSKCSCHNPNLVEAEAVDHLPCPCEAAKVQAVEVRCCSEEPCHAAVPKCMEASTLVNGRNVAVVRGNFVE